MTGSGIPAVLRTATVQASPSDAFRTFVEPTAWWPAAHQVAAEPFVEVVVERQAGGRWYERAADGTTCEWGRVLAYDPPNRLVLAWHLDAAWEFDPAPEHASEIDMTFAEVRPGTTLVTLEHRWIERHGAGADRIAEAVATPGGWDSVLESFAAASVSVGAAPR